MPFRDETKWVHRVWLDDESQPEDYKLVGLMWGDMNPTWRVVDWDARALHAQDLQGVPRSFSLTHQQRCDIAGLALVHQYGGVYACCDMEPTSPLAEVPEYTAWMSHSGYLGSRAVQDPVWGLLLDLLRYMGRDLTPETDLTAWYRSFSGSDLILFDGTPRANDTSKGRDMQDQPL